MTYFDDPRLRQFEFTKVLPEVTRPFFRYTVRWGERAPKIDDAIAYGESALSRCDYIGSMAISTSWPRTYDDVKCVFE